MITEYFKHQKDFLDANHAKHLACWDTGTGKTVIGVEWCKLSPDLGRSLIICPKALKKNWQREVEKRKAKDVTIMTKEEFRRDWATLDPHLKVVVDEAHYFAGPKSQMTKALRAFIKKWNVPKILLLTATPYMSTPWNVYTLGNHLGKEWSWVKFRDKFFVDRYIGRRVVPEPRPGIEKDMAVLVASLGSIVRLDECVDVPPQVFETEVFDLTKEQEKAKKEIIEINPVVRFTKYHQLENGVLKGNEYVEDQMWVTNKEDRLLELVEQNDKIIVVCRYNLQLDLYAAEFGQFKKPIFLIRGDVKDRDTVVQQAEAAEKAIVLIQAQCSEGYELPSFPMMVFASLSFSYKDYKQMIGRILRINKLKKNMYLHLVTKGVDTAVYNAIMKKQDFDIEIYAREHTGTDEEILGEGFPDGF